MTPQTAETPSEVKARGAFYTPPKVAAFISRWAIRSGDDHVLEPACGDGSFIASAVERFAELGRTAPTSLVGIERSPEEAGKAARLAPDSDIRTASFFDVDPDEFSPFDAVIGNPPYIRYHGFVGEDREKGLARATAQGVQLTRLASSWAHFVVHATSFLSDNGRLGLVLPAELLVTDYAQAVRAHLLARFASVVVIAFDRMVFEDAQVDAVLLLASNDIGEGIRLIRVADADALDGIDVDTGTGEGQRHGGRWTTSMDAEAEATYRDLIESGRAIRLSSIATVDIGIVTGANRYFVLDAREAERLQLPDEYLSPIVERPRDAPGLTLADGETRRLLLLPQAEISDASVLAYLSAGKTKGVDKGYKCRVRRFWYAVPVPRKRADAFLPYMTGDAPRLIVNPARAWSTNLLHGVSLAEGAPDIRSLSVAMLSSITLLSAEVEGRAYGGGVLKLETRESERLLVPKISPSAEPILARMHPELDALVREGNAARATRLVDAVLGIDSAPLDRARLVFRTRRLNRGGRKDKAATP